jgi:putative PIN family toxin of toxin-antitoxin system
VKVVPDTMVWLSYCTLKESYRHRLIEHARRQRVRFFVSDYILQELVSTLVEDLGRTQRYAMLARRAVLRIAKLVELPPAIRRHVPGDPHDDPIVQTALTAKADYLVTADRQILNLSKVEDVEIITPTQLGDKLGLQP